MQVRYLNGILNGMICCTGNHPDPASSAHITFYQHNRNFSNLFAFFVSMLASSGFYRVLHVLCWLMFFSMVLFFVNMSTDYAILGSKLLSGPYLVFFLIYPAIFYLNLSVLFPRLFLKKKIGWYFLLFAVLFALVFYVKPFDTLIKTGNNMGSSGMELRDLRPGAGRGPRNERNEQRVNDERYNRENRFDRQQGPPPRPGDNGEGFGPRSHGMQKSARGPALDIMSIILFILTWSVSTGLGVFRQWRTTEQRVLKAEAEKANAELSFLRAQVNPHFLFNTLNNIYSMAVTKNPNTAESILKLSNIMRYVTDEGKENFVNLDSELDCLRDYIDLHRIRLGTTTQVNFNVHGDPGTNVIAPLLLMTFVENAFKYGTSNHETSVIDISVIIDGELIKFMCRNKLFSVARNPERAGIGITNARQRLQSLYAGRHQLQILQQHGSYTVELELEKT